MFVSYVIQYMDKSILGQTAFCGLQDDLGLAGQDYSWCASLFYFDCLALQPFATIGLTYCKPRKLVAWTSLAWAIILFCTAGASSFAGMVSEDHTMAEL